MSGHPNVRGRGLRGEAQWRSSVVKLVLDPLAAHLCAPTSVLSAGARRSRFQELVYVSMEHIDEAAFQALLRAHSGACYLIVGHSRAGYEEWPVVQVRGRQV